MLNRRPAALIGLLAILLVGVTGYYLLHRKLQRATFSAGQSTLQITPEISLQYYTTLTLAQPEVRFGKQKGWSRLFDFLPPDWGKSIPYVQPIAGTAIQSYIPPSANSGTMLMMVNLSPNYIADTADLSAKEIQEKIGKAIRDQKIKSVRFFAREYGASAPMDNLQVDSIRRGALSGGLRNPAADETFFFVRLPLSGVPVMAPDLTIQLMEKSYIEDDNPVIREFTIANPFYKPVSPSTQTADALPASIKDGALEVTLRALVSGAANTHSILTPEKRGFLVDLLRAASDESTAPEKRRITFKPDKPIPDEGPIPLDCFAQATTDTKAFTFLVADVTSGGLEQEEWGLKRVDVTYGKEKIPFGRSGESTFSYDKTHVQIYNGILSAYPQPVNVSIELIRKANFPADESQTVEVALPKAGTFIGTKQAIKLQAGIIDEVVLGYQCREYTSAFGRVMLGPEPLSVIYKGYVQGGLEAIELLSQDGVTLPIENQYAVSSVEGTSSIIACYQQFYIPAKEKGTSSPVNYDDYTTARLTFRSPRTYPRKFKFTATAQDIGEPETSR